MGTVSPANMLEDCSGENVPVNGASSIVTPWIAWRPQLRRR